MRIPMPAPAIVRAGTSPPPTLRHCTRESLSPALPRRRGGACPRPAVLRANHTLAVCLVFIWMSAPLTTRAETGYDLWLRYLPSKQQAEQQAYAAKAAAIVVQGRSPSARAAAKELQRGLAGLLGH